MTIQPALGCGKMNRAISPQPKFTRAYSHLPRHKPFYRAEITQSPVFDAVTHIFE
jgi:hypothetical protein